MPNSKQQDKATAPLGGLSHQRIQQAFRDLEDLPESLLLQAYHALTGETLDQTIVRRRMMKATRWLLLSRDTPQKIAKTLGFSRYDQFEREFIEVHGLSPETYREEGRLLASGSDQAIETLYLPTIANWPNIRVAALRHYGDYIDEGLVLDRLYGWAKSKGIDFRTARRFCLFHDDPMLTPVELLSCDCLVEVPSHIESDGDIAVFELPARTRLTVRHKGPYAELEMAYFWMTRWYAPQNGLPVRSTPILAEYVNSPRGIPPAEWLTDMSIEVSDAL